MASRLPKSLYAEYYRSMLKRIRFMETYMAKVYIEKISPLILQFEKDVRAQKVANNKLRNNSRFLDGLSDSLLRQYNFISNKIDVELTDAYEIIDAYFSDAYATGLASKFVDTVVGYDRRSIDAQIHGVLGTEKYDKLKGLNILEDEGLQELIASEIKNNVELIKSVPEKYFEHIQKSIHQGFEKGQSTMQIAREIQAVSGVTERRAELIARDQLGTVYAEVTQQRQENLGIKRFKWQTVHDERVRDSHRAIDGRIFNWDEGAVGYDVAEEVKGLLPGEDFNCRCVAAPVDEDIFELFDRLSKE